VTHPIARLTWSQLLIALSILLTLALGGVLLFLLLRPAPHPGTPASSTHIVLAQTSSGIDQFGAPTDATTSFAVGQAVYITYTISDAGPGTATITLYHTGSLVDTQSQHFPRRSTYNAYFLFHPAQPGRWEADLSWQAAGSPPPGTLEQKVPFLVGDATLVAVSPPIFPNLNRPPRLYLQIVLCWHQEVSLSFSLC
jgi:hypothetical protein